MMTQEPQAPDAAQPEPARDGLDHVHATVGPRVQEELNQKVGAQASAMQEQHAAEARDEGERAKPDAGHAHNAGDKAASGGTTPDTPTGDRGSLPPEVIAQFPDADLSGVTVVRSSPNAKQRGVRGFATRDEIHVAPGADEMAVIRHEAAHVVQMRKDQPGKAASTEAENETAARAAESGAKQAGKDLGTAPAEATRNFDGNGEDKQPDVPDPVTILGTLLTGKSGSRHLGFEKFTLFDIDHTTPPAGFPVLSFISFTPQVRLKYKASFSAGAMLRWEVVKEADKPVFQVSVTPDLWGGIEGTAAFALKFAVGAPFDLAGISGTLGASGKVMASYFQKEQQPFVGRVSTDGKLIPRTPGVVGGGEIDSKAFLDLTVAVAIYAGLPSFIAKGWRWEEKKEWLVASVPIHFPKISIPAIPLPTELTGDTVKGQLGATKPTAPTVTGQTLTPG